MVMGIWTRLRLEKPRSISNIKTRSKGILDYTWCSYANPSDRCGLAIIPHSLEHTCHAHTQTCKFTHTPGLSLRRLTVMGFRGLRITRPPRDQTDNSVYINTMANNTSAMKTHHRRMDGDEILQRASAWHPGGTCLAAWMDCKTEGQRWYLQLYNSVCRSVAISPVCSLNSFLIRWEK